jgi:two-component system sensor histidine kinase/response regulator
MKQKILCVDDEIDNVDALERLFRNKYTVLKATSGLQALSILDQHPEPISLIITDQRMPQMTGVEFLSQSLKTHPDATRILLTGYTDMESIIAAVNSGQIYRYINKPWDPVDLLNTVEKAVERFELHRELKLKNIELNKALEELKILDQAKNQFMILINHELKTPLTTILSFSELLSETSLNEEQVLCLQRVQNGANRLKDLVDDVLLIVSAETKVLKPKITSFDDHQLLSALPQSLQLQIENKNQLLKKNWLGKKILADLNLVEQVLMRILHNASKFGQPNSEIVIESLLIQSHRLQIRVVNRGPQISDSIIDKILKPFFLDEDVMNHSVGMGLGLTLSQAILRSHGSTLNIRNRTDGVEVLFELPCL